MNEFTKEELEYISNYIFKGAACIRFDHHEALKHKIQSMIDNYCEHEWENICCQCTLDKIYCHKCEKDMGDLEQRYDE